VAPVGWGTPVSTPCFYSIYTIPLSATTTMHKLILVFTGLLCTGSGRRVWNADLFGTPYRESHVPTKPAGAHQDFGYKRHSESSLQGYKHDDFYSGSHARQPCPFYHGIEVSQWTLRDDGALAARVALLGAKANSWQVSLADSGKAIHIRAVRPLPARRACLPRDTQVSRDGSTEIVDTDVSVPAGWDVMRTTVRDAHGLLEITVPPSKASTQRASQKGYRSSMDLHDARWQSHDYKAPAEHTQPVYHTGSLSRKHGNEYNMPRQRVPQHNHGAGSSLDDSQLHANTRKAPRQHAARNGYHASELQDSRPPAGDHNARRHRAMQNQDAGRAWQDSRPSIGDRDIHRQRPTRSGQSARQQSANEQHASQRAHRASPASQDGDSSAKIELLKRLFEQHGDSSNTMDLLERLFEQNGHGTSGQKAEASSAGQEGDSAVQQTQEASLDERTASLLDLHGSDGVEVVEEEYPEPVKMSNAAEGFWDNRGEFQQY